MVFLSGLNRKTGSNLAQKAADSASAKDKTATLLSLKEKRRRLDTVYRHFANLQYEYEQCLKLDAWESGKSLRLLVKNVIENKELVEALSLQSDPHFQTTWMAYLLMTP